MTDIAEEMDRRFPIAANEEAGSRSPSGRTIDGRPVASACGVEQATSPELAKALKAYDEAVLSGREREADLMHDVRRLRSKLAEATAQRDALSEAAKPLLAAPLVSSRWATYREVAERLGEAVAKVER